MRRQLHIEQLERRTLMAADWRNPTRVYDVNNDSLVSALDALVGINRLNDSRGELPLRAEHPNDPYYDVSGDGNHSPIDVLIVINTLNGSTPLLQVNLGSDTGSGASAISDLITNNAAIRGTTTGHAVSLQAKFEGDDDWKDLSAWLKPDGTFELTHEQVEAEVQHSFVDGQQSLLFIAGAQNQPQALYDKRVLKFKLDRSSPVSQVVESSVIDSNLISIPFNEPLSAASLDKSQVKLFDITWGEKKSDKSWTSATDFPRFELQPQSIELSPDGMTLQIDTPAHSGSIKYLVEIQSAVEDIAGNKVASTATAPTVAKFHYFATNVPTLEFGKTIKTSYQFEPRILEYKFSLNAPDKLVWAGNLAVGTLSKFELYDGTGQLIQTLLPGAYPELGTANLPHLFSLEAGEYRLRFVDPPVAGSLLGVYLASQLPEILTDRASGNSDVWPMDVSRVTLSRGERLFYQAVDLNSKTALRTVFSPGGSELAVQTSGVEQFVEANQEGEYIVLTNRVGYRTRRSLLNERVVQVNETVSDSLPSASVRERFVFPVTPGETYALASLVGSDLRLEVDRNLSWGNFYRMDDKLMIVIPQSATFVVNLEHVSWTDSESDFQIVLQPISEVAKPLQYDITYAAPTDAYQIYVAPDTLVDEVLPSGGPSTQIGFVQKNLQWVERNAQGVAFRDVDSNCFFLVKGLNASQTWSVRHRQTISQDLTVDQPTELSFSPNFKRYEFNFYSEANRFYRADIDPEARSNITLESENGVVDLTIYLSSNYFIWLIPTAGKCKLIIKDSQGWSPLTTTFQLSQMLTSELNQNVPQVVLPTTNSLDLGRTFFTLPAGTESMNLRTNVLALHALSEWTLLDQYGVLAASRYLYAYNEIPDREEVPDWETLLDPNLQYFLVVRNYSQIGNIEFVRL